MCRHQLASCRGVEIAANLELCLVLEESELYESAAAACRRISHRRKPHSTGPDRQPAACASWKTTSSVSGQAKKLSRKVLAQVATILTPQTPSSRFAHMKDAGRHRHEGGKHQHSFDRALLPELAVDCKMRLGKPGVTVASKILRQNRDRFVKLDCP